MPPIITLIGAGGTIVTETAKHLLPQSVSLRMVSRTPKAVPEGVAFVSADLLDAAATNAAIAGSDIVLLAPGLTYNAKLWERQWPVVMTNVIQACLRHQARLLFFDNLYALGHVNGWMTEDTPLQATSRKGRVRARLHHLLLDAHANGLTYQIARAADFYGGGTETSFLNLMVLKPLAQGKKASFLVRADVVHHYLYTPDAGRAVARLLLTDSAWNQTWNLPVDPSPLTGLDVLRICTEVLGHPVKHTNLAPWLIRLVGLFQPYVRETVELLYQNQYPYQVDSRKFAAAFPDFRTTPYIEGIATALRAYQG